MNTFLSAKVPIITKRKRKQKQTNEQRRTEQRRKKPIFDNYNIIAFPTYAYDRRRF